MVQEKTAEIEGGAEADESDDGALFLHQISACSLLWSADDGQDWSCFVVIACESFVCQTCGKLRGSGGETVGGLSFPNLPLTSSRYWSGWYKSTGRIWR